MSQPSLLEICRDKYPPRSLPIALGQVLANTKPGPHMDTLNRIYMGLSPADRLRCRDELSACRAAKRGHIEAVVA